VAGDSGVASSGRGGATIGSRARAPDVTRSKSVWNRNANRMTDPPERRSVGRRSAYAVTRKDRGGGCKRGKRISEARISSAGNIVCGLLGTRADACASSTRALARRCGKSAAAPPELFSPVRRTAQRAETGLSFTLATHSRRRHWPQAIILPVHTAFPQRAHGNRRGECVAASLAHTMPIEAPSRTLSYRLHRGASETRVERTTRKGRQRGRSPEDPVLDTLD
jgi:hypothetical protein